MLPSLFTAIDGDRPRPLVIAGVDATNSGSPVVVDVLLAARVVSRDQSANCCIPEMFVAHIDVVINLSLFLFELVVGVLLSYMACHINQVLNRFCIS